MRARERENDARRACARAFARSGAMCADEIYEKKKIHVLVVVHVALLSGVVLSVQVDAL